MTMRKKLIAMICCLSVVLCTLVTGTIAWLTDKTPSIENTFTSSDISITLSENNYNNDETPLTNSFKMVPGAKIAKDPYVTVATGSEACWLFVKIEKGNGFDDYMTFGIADGWTQLKDADGNNVSGVYYRSITAENMGKRLNVLKGEGTDELKDGYVQVLDKVTKSMMNALNDSNFPTLTFTAYAIQSANLTDANGNAVTTAAAAWELIK